MMDSNDGLRMTASNDGLRIMGLHFYLISRAFILFRLWASSFFGAQPLFYVCSLLSADFVFLWVSRPSFYLA